MQCQLNINLIPTQRDADLVEQEFYELVQDRPSLLTLQNRFSCFLAPGYFYCKTMFPS